MTLMTCVPSGAPDTSVGSASEGIVASSTGVSLGRPYFEASKARSMGSMPGATRIRPRRSRSSPFAAGKRGTTDRTRVTLAPTPGRRMVAARGGGPPRAADRPAEPQPEEGVAEARADDVGRRLVAKRRQEAAQHPHAAVEVRVGGGVLLGPAVQPLPRPGRGGGPPRRAAGRAVPPPPPPRSPRPTTSVRRPLFARYPAVTRELWPAPMTIAAWAVEGLVVISGRLPAAGLQVLHGGQAAVGAHDPAARVGRGAAQPEIADGRPEAGVAGHRSAEEELLESQLALEDVALGQADDALHVERRVHLAPDDDLPDVRRPLGDGVDDRVAEGFALVVPGAQARVQPVRRVLHEAADDVLAGRRHGG